ncbi:MAG: SDR family oxidoreductase [Flavobacteriales bacterium]|nr:SDR family oxidoreductase [Flavobacteriales bacterium]
MNYFKNKIVWITGASSGIGEALAKQLDKAGAILILSSRNVQELQRVRASLTNPESWILPLDLASNDTFEQHAKQVIEKFGKIDILINNGGISQRSLVAETSLSVDQRIMQVNFLGTVALTKAVLPYFLTQGYGHIVTVSSVTGLYGTPFRSSYAASKHALHGFFDSLRAELHGKNIAVTLVCPGFVRTPITLHALTGDGTPLNIMDKGTSEGLDVDVFAKKMLYAVSKQKNRIIIGGFKEKFGVFMKRFFPSLFDKLIVKISVR